MKCSLRRWQMSDAQDLAHALNNQTIHDYLRDGLPFPIRSQMHKPIFDLWRKQNLPLRSLWMTEQSAVSVLFAKKISIIERLRLATLLHKSIGEKA